MSTAPPSPEKLGLDRLGSVSPTGMTGVDPTPDCLAFYRDRTDGWSEENLPSG